MFNEEACREQLVALRWPKGVQCIVCSSAVVRAGHERNGSQRFQCSQCGLRFGITAGTALQDARVSLALIFAAIELLLIEPATTLSALEKMLKISHRSASLIALLLRGAIAQTKKPTLEKIMRTLLSASREELAAHGYIR